MKNQHIVKLIISSSMTIGALTPALFIWLAGYEIPTERSPQFALFIAYVIGLTILGYLVGKFVSWGYEK